MLDILSVTTPIYLAIATGFLTARFGLFSKSEMRVLGRFVIHIALPALLFNALIQRRKTQVIAAALGTHVALGGALVTLFPGMLEPQSMQATLETMQASGTNYICEAIALTPEGRKELPSLENRLAALVS